MTIDRAKCSGKNGMLQFQIGFQLLSIHNVLVTKYANIFFRTGVLELVCFRIITNNFVYHTPVPIWDSVNMVLHSRAYILRDVISVIQTYCKDALNVSVIL
jgi:hypothetical protein